ncbi:MAG: NADH-dependent oxidoreductase [Planctomycetaceae bacterium]|nr:MAG: NADH-dependent oxidoreductase [Planctomycetaceae bacterium]
MSHIPRVRQLRLIFFLLFTTVPSLAKGESPSQVIFIETESFDDYGGWTLETSFTHIVGSAYLMAHGLGLPVADATTTIHIPTSGEYHIWVRTKDWVAPWKASGQPGRFGLKFNDILLPTVFGTEGADWHWQRGGKIHLAAGKLTLALHDLTGFNGRADAILLTTEEHLVPPEGQALSKARRHWLQLPRDPDDAGEFDLVVVGGGYAGLGTAISAARQALRVALIQDRFVLGGNGSSEIRVWANGGTMRGKFPHLGEIVEEFADHAPDSPAAPEHFGDALKAAVCQREKTLSLFLGHFAREVELDPATQQIRAVIALEVKTGREKRFRGKLFADCTGHGHVGAAAGASFLMEPLGRMGMSNMFYWQFENEPQDWPTTPWALQLEPGDFPPQVPSRSLIDGKPFMKGEWFWESGFNKHPIQELELIRDWNLRAVFGAFSALKHGPERAKYSHAALKWVAAIGGPRESRMLIGDVILTREDIVNQRTYPDGCVPTTWDIDLHYPKEQYARKYPDNPFISRAEFGAGVDRKNGYPIPYRCLYSRDIPNLFMAGRCISVNHEALGTVRVMRTCGMMGEVVGKAAYLCVIYQTTPRGIYESHLEQLFELLRQPGAMRRDTLYGPLYRDPGIGQVMPYFNKSQDRVTGELVAQPKPMISLDSLPGIVVDDAQAQLIGAWNDQGSLTPHVGNGYRYAPANSGAVARFIFRLTQAGRYELRIAWMGHANRSSKTLCVIERQGLAPIRLRLNQREQPPSDQAPFHSIGVFELPAGESAVLISSEGADGLVHVDAIQLLEVRAAP